MKPTSNPVILPIEANHIPRVEQIWADRLGAPQERIDAWLEHVIDENSITEGFVVVNNGHILGFAIVTVANEEYLDEYLAHPDMTIDVWPKTGICEAIAVDADYQSKGIGTELVKQQLNYLEMCDTDGAVTVSWHRENHYDSRPLFTKLGFDPVETHDNYYARLPGDVHCIDCPGSCECGATVFVRSADK